MGWANCGDDSKGRPIGYAHPATCDHPGCKAKIDRGLAYACGGMHGTDEHSCEGYFCEEHRSTVELPDGECESLCAACSADLNADCAEQLIELLTPRPRAEWHEDYGNVLWWEFPIEEPPYSGTPLDSDWPGYHTHWTPIPAPMTPRQ